MKVLFTGLGSIGTRHLKNLHSAASEMGVSVTADALRSSERHLPDATKALVANEYTSSNDLGHYDAVFITNPTSLHFDTLKALKGKAGALFIEKPIFDATNLDIEACIESGQKAYVAAPMRWCGTMLALKELLPSLKVYSARVLCSSYLPDWRPNVDYRNVYSAHKDMGGGVTIDLIHEWDYIAELFGTPEKVYNLKGKYSHLEIDSDDLSIYIARFKTLLCEVHLDYFGRKYRRSIELFCENGTVTADFYAGTLTLENGDVKSFAEDVNERYMREMRYFLQYALNGEGKSVNTPETALQVLKITEGEQL